MGEGFLIDTNILIYYLADAIPTEEIPKIEKILKESFNISIITKIEFLGWKGHTPEGFEKSKEFISFAHVIPLTDDIAELAIELRRRKSIKLPDAVIAATALKYGYTLVTRNVRDFEGIGGLRIYNPFENVDGKG
ncbi:type II toxin-antitoxin system VapC family toxin [Thermococcus sp. Bubb.Bath]|uniref:type II toxin-antitoxin system VapC family toxin n=1 Tax=Thermococcus sp. Bubb.Bath TaxID=1638242 RepID=UPI001F0EAD29|nr:type II toxin-antitoxin system VapC family toxin [Thermococcus sp. Bubb.Bath]